MSKFQIGITFFVLFILLFRFYLYNQSEKIYSNNQKISLTTTLLDQPQIAGKYQKFSILIDNKDKVFIITNRFPQFYYGETVKISGLITLRQLQGTNNQSNKVKRDEKVIITMFFPKIEKIETPKSFPLEFVSSIRLKITDLYHKTLPPNSASLLIGIVFGIKEHMDQNFSENLKKAGVLHVIAASGMNVTMIGGFLSTVFVFFFRRQYALVLTIVCIMFYTVLSGLDPSIVRASIMGILAFSAQILGRQTLSLYSLLIAGYFMLLFSPNLIFDTGFQLSFSSTLGIIYLQPIFLKSKKLGLIIKKSIIGDDIVTTISAQVSALPVLLANFGNYSLLSILANAFLLWTIPFLMVFGLIASVLGFVFEPSAKIFLYFCLPLLLYFEKVVNFFGGTAIFWKTDQFPLQFSITYYLLIISFVLFKLEKK